MATSLFNLVLYEEVLWEAIEDGTIPEADGMFLNKLKQRANTVIVPDALRDIFFDGSAEDMCRINDTRAILHRIPAGSRVFVYGEWPNHFDRLMRAVYPFSHPPWPKTEFVPGSRAAIQYLE